MSDFAKELMKLFTETEPKMGPWKKTTPELKRLHREHIVVTEKLSPEFRAAGREYRRLKQALEDEQERWGDAMTAAAPELKDVENIHFSDDGTKFRTTFDGAQPDWAKELENDFQNHEADTHRSY